MRLQAALFLVILYMTYDFSKISVLVLDDNKFMRDLIKGILQTFGIKRIFTCDDGAVGFKIFCEESPDLVITDWIMEKNSGLQFTEKVRRDSVSPNPFVPIILLTGFAEENRVIKARDAGITEFLVKPFKAIDLYKRIEQIIEKPRKYVKSIDFFGPDRRRRETANFSGPFRREEDHDID